jgi:hypothetical protein
MARRRCLMVLSVLSGERSVTEVIAQAQISRQLYYVLETRALEAMLGALAPGAETDVSSEGKAAARRVVELEAKVHKLEQQRRRSERLLYLTRKVVKPGPVAMAGGRPSRSGPRSRTAGPSASRSSTTTKRSSTSTTAGTTSSSATSPTSPTASAASASGMPTPAGAGER